MAAVAFPVIDLLQRTNRQAPASPGHWSAAVEAKMLARKADRLVVDLAALESRLLQAVSASCPARSASMVEWVRPVLEHTVPAGSAVAAALAPVPHESPALDRWLPL